jgi:hypothetical protein
VAESDYTTDDLTRIRAAIRKGERSVTFADRSVSYRSAEELLELEARIVRALSAAASTRPRKQTRIVSGKGFF